MRLLLRFLGLLFAAGTTIFIVAIAAAAGLLWHYSQSLPDYSQLQDYEPAVMTRVHAADGSLLAEYARERRLYIPVQAVPKLVINAFVAAEDKNFYEHGGIDFSGIARAAVLYIQQYGSGRRPQGASTITQQVAKNFLLTNELSFARKIKEALLAMKIERAFSKERILELYLNEIYLGMGAYGVAAASLLYFDKSVHELSVAEAAYLAALPKAPNNYHPFRQRERALERARLGEEVPRPGDVPVGDTREILRAQLVAELLADVTHADIDLAGAIAVAGAPHPHPGLESVRLPPDAQAVDARTGGDHLTLGRPMLGEPELRIEAAERVPGPALAHRGESGLGVLRVPTREHSDVRPPPERQLRAREPVPARSREPSNPRCAAMIRGRLFSEPHTRRLSRRSKSQTSRAGRPLQAQRVKASRRAARVSRSRAFCAA